uniref:Uncharacterized protein n=2 Tax=Meloidogyne enterolobii TaxID=390850 RepID=A0A6V7V2L1_MELEN|nr:unnamed protein product [Meloidogyne enterolobii]
MLNTINGTFFRLLTQLELIDTREFEFGNSPNYLGLEFSLFVHFRDDRLQFRDLNDLPISLPDEFTPWQPRIQILPLLTTQTIQSQKSIHLNPKNGLITFVYRFSGQLFCNSDIWKEPFEKYSCQFWFETELDERLQLTVIRDLRPTEQINKIGNKYEQWPWLLLRFKFCSLKWKKALICEYLPSLMLFVCALLAQWKRRKIQVVVLIGVIICLILMQNILYSKNISSTFSIKLNLMDFWLAGIFVHLICLLSIDLAFPSRRVIIFKQKIIKKRINDNNIPLESREIDNELIVHKGERKQRRRITTTLNSSNYSSPLISTLSRKLGVHQHKFPTFGRHLHHHLPSSSNSLLHHYVSSPKLSGNQQKQQKSPLISNYKRRILSVLPTSISSSPSSPFNSTKYINSYNQIIRTSSVPPFKAATSSFSEAGKEDVNDERRQRAIAQLLNEMERIRNIDNDDNEAVDGTDKLITQSSSQQNSPLIKNQQNKQFLRAPPTPPLPPSQPPTNIPQSSLHSQQQNTYYSFKYPQNVARQYKIGKVQQFSDEEEEEELGRIEGSGLGMSRQKRIPFLVIFTSFCIFLCGYLILVLMVLFEWL